MSETLTVEQVREYAGGVLGVKPTTSTVVNWCVRGIKLANGQRGKKGRRYLPCSIEHRGLISVRMVALADLREWLAWFVARDGQNRMGSKRKASTRRQTHVAQ